MKRYHNNLRRLREARGLTQQEVAEALGLASTNRISKWERGVMYPHVLNFLKLMEIYAVQAKDIYPPTDLPVETIDELGG
jgi:transcriptional regulator with XRE-family HTH domain